MRLNCIVVDDEPTSRVRLIALIERNSDRLNLVGEASSGEEAKKLLSSTTVDVIFLDVMMPGMSGFELLDEMEFEDDIQVVLVTSNEEFALKAYDYGITDYLLKPFSHYRFNKAIDRVLKNNLNTLTGAGVSSENVLLEKLMRFIYTRDIDVLEPIPSREHLFGYVYPMLTTNLDFENEHEAFDILEEAEREGLLVGTYVNTLYLCYNCHNSYLNLRESCPNCESSNLESEDLIHHFSCAYMGPLSDFKPEKGSRNLQCPKCERSLKHIGVDYDKPSAIFNCNSCDHVFQDPLIRAKCLNCRSDIRVEHLVKKVLKKYRMTADGADFASGNRHVLPHSKDGVQQSLMETPSFRNLVSNEIKRKKKGDFESFIGIMRFVGIEELYHTIGHDRKGKLMTELHDLVYNEIAPGDEVVFTDESTLLLFLPEKTRDEVLPRIEKIGKRIRELIRDNFEGFKTGVKVAVTPIAEGSTYDSLTDHLKDEVSTLAMGGEEEK